MRRIFFLLFTCLCLAQVSAEIHPPQSEKTPDKSGVTSKVTFSPDLYSLEFIQQEDGSFKPSTENVTITFERKDPGTFCTKIKEVSASVWGPATEYVTVQDEQRGMWVANGNRMEFRGKTYKTSTGKSPGFCNFDGARIVIPAFEILSHMGTSSMNSSDRLKSADVCGRYDENPVTHVPDFLFPRPVYIDTGFNSENAMDSYTRESRRILVSTRCRRAKPEGAREVILRAAGKYLGVDPSRGFEMRSDRSSAGDTERFWLRSGASENWIRLQSTVGGKYACQNDQNGQVYAAYNFDGKGKGCMDPRLEIVSPGRVRITGNVWVTTGSQTAAQKRYWVPLDGLVKGSANATPETVFEILDANTRKPIAFSSVAGAKNSFSMGLADGSLPGAKLTWKLVRVSDGMELNMPAPNQGSLIIEDFVGTEYRMDFFVSYQGKEYRPGDKPTVRQNEMQPAVTGIVNANVQGSDEKPAAPPENRTFSLLEGDRKSHWYKVSFKEYLNVDTNKIRPNKPDLLKPGPNR
ncbi:MAG TPA: hypothetical protein PKX74_13630 [Leptospiraceae bacterium]|nr:hypothetical protein [Leptospiraceae bacterium]